MGVLTERESNYVENLFNPRSTSYTDFFMFQPSSSDKRDKMQFSCYVVKAIIKNNE